MKNKLSYINPYSNLQKIEDEGNLVIERGEGIYVYDDKGNKYIEGLAGLWCTSLGFSNKKLVKAAYNQSNKLPYYHSFTGKVPKISLELSNKLNKITPKQFEKFIFANSGSESNDTAIKMVWYYFNALGLNKKKKIISRNRGYHGVNVLSGSLTGLEYAHKGFDLPRSVVLHTDSPHYYKYAKNNESEGDFVDRILNNLQNLINEEGPETIGAMIMEPIQGAGGVIIPPIQYLEKLQKILKQNNILLIVDEVICGFGRTGKMFASEKYNIEADMMVMAKGLSSGYAPISALTITNDIYNTVKEYSTINGVFGHGYTYSGHPLASAISLECLKVYEGDGFLDKVNKKSKLFCERINSLSKHECVGHARATGLIGAIELKFDKKFLKKSNDKKLLLSQFLVSECQREGLIIRALPDNIIAFCPPLTITNKEINLMFDIIDNSIESLNN